MPNGNNIDTAELQKLYGAVSEEFEIGTFDKFIPKMDTKEKRQRFYNVISEELDIGDYNTFEQRLLKKKKPTPSPALVGELPSKELETITKEVYPLEPVEEEKVAEVAEPAPPTPITGVPGFIPEVPTELPLGAADIPVVDPRIQEEEIVSKGFLPEIPPGGLQIEARLVSAKNAFIQGVSTMLTSIPKTIGILAAKLGEVTDMGETDPHKMVTYQIGQYADDLVRELFPINPEFQEEFITTTLPSAAGSLIGFIGGGAVGTTLKVGRYAIPAMLGSSSLGASEYESAFERVADANNLTPEDYIKKYVKDDRSKIPELMDEYNINKGKNPNDVAFDAFLFNAAIGVSEGLPIGLFFRRLDKVTGGSVKTTLGKYAQNKIVTGYSRNPFVAGTIVGFQEGLQEVFQNAATNYTASQMYDMTRDIFDGNTFKEGSAGFILGTTLGAFGFSIKRRMAQKDVTKQDKLIDQQILDYLAKKKDQLPEDLREHHIFEKEDSKDVIKLKKQKLIIDKDVVDDKGSEESRQGLIEKSRELSKEIDDLKQQELDAKKGADLKEGILEDLNSKKEQFENDLKDPALNEESKKVVREKLREINEDIEEAKKITEIEKVIPSKVEEVPEAPPIKVEEEKVPEKPKVEKEKVIPERIPPEKVPEKIKTIIEKPTEELKATDVHELAIQKGLTEAEIESDTFKDATADVLEAAGEEQVRELDKLTPEQLSIVREEVNANPAKFGLVVKEVVEEKPPKVVQEEVPSPVPPVVPPAVPEVPKPLEIAFPEEARVEEVTKQTEIELKPSTREFIIKLKDISIDVDRFQNRDAEYSQKSVDKILKAVREGTYNEGILGATLMWKDPKDNKLYVLAGHSRVKAHQILSEEGRTEFNQLPIRLIEGYTEEQAIDFATKLSNKLHGDETSTERAKIYRRDREKGMSETKITEEAKDVERANWVFVVNLSHLNPAGKAITAVESFAESTDIEGRQKIEAIADWTGAIRKQFKDLSNLHEDEIYDFLIDAYSKTKQAGKVSNKQAFIALAETVIDRAKTRGEFDADRLINFKNFIGRSSHEIEYDSRLAEAKKKVDDFRKESDDKREDLVDKGATQIEMDRILKPLEDKLRRAIKDLNEIRKQKGLVKEATRNQTSIFDEIEEVKQKKEVSDDKITEVRNAPDDEITRLERLAKSIEVKTEAAGKAEEIEAGIAEIDDAIRKPITVKLEEPELTTLLEQAERGADIRSEFKEALGRHLKIIEPAKQEATKKLWEGRLSKALEKGEVKNCRS